ncbi:hypothetical protein SD37_09420 [Amycolatopsis orientalis]|uniref:Enamine deaminase RidA n=2 Tax=Amycolatopsis orientalis TaxID=31958 RepID=A0A193CBC1_AMYOR|nr:hypothetical protein SD37_09420 [Amycolatopsis orientalis]
MGPYSTAIRSNGFVHLSGQGGLDPATGERVPGGIQAETMQTVANIEALLGRAGLSLMDLVSVTCYLVDLGEWEMMNRAYSTALGDARPVRTAVGVSALPFGLRLEMTAIADAAR